MNLQNFHFTQHRTHQTAELGVYLRGYWVTRSVLELAQELASANLPTLPWHKSLQAKQICFHPDWPKWSKTKKENIGRCLRRFHDDGLLPLTLVNPNKKGPRRYQRK